MSILTIMFNIFAKSSSSVLRKVDISLKHERFVFAQKQVEFCGYLISEEGYCINPSITKAITQFPKPSDLHSFFGLANQLSEFTDTIAPIMEPLRPLLKPKNTFCWGEVHDQAFQKTKEAFARLALDDRFIVCGCLLLIAYSKR